MDYIYLIGGIVLLLLSGNWLVKSGVAIAEYFRIPPFIVGVTVISLGTSAPELFVSLNAAISGSPDIAIGNIIGSNIANIGLVLAITAIVINIPVQKTTIRFDFPVLIIATALFTYFMFDLIISRTEGIIMLGLMLVYILLIVKFNRHKSETPKEERRKGKNNPIKSLIIIVISCFGLLFGSNILVEGAGNIACSIGISERVISITVIAFGTSIPELATSVIAAFRKQIDISVGNIIGSNIFNILVISGVTSTAVPLKVNQSTLDFDIFFLGGFVLLMGLFFIPFKRAEISRWKGLVFLLAYFTYYLVLFYH